MTAAPPLIPPAESPIPFADFTGGAADEMFSLLRRGRFEEALIELEECASWLLSAEECAAIGALIRARAQQAAIIAVERAIFDRDAGAVRDRYRALMQKDPIIYDLHR